MKISALSSQTRNPNQVNISIDGKYRLSLDIAQVTELGIKPGREIDEAELALLEVESQFGKLYARALEYCLMRPHSAREMNDYLWRRTQMTRYKSRSGELKVRAGASRETADRVFDRLVARGYIDDEKFARWWVENRQQNKGISRRKLQAELRTKGLVDKIIDSVLQETERSDASELAKVIAKKRSKYPDDQKLILYLARQGFSYDDIKQALDTTD